jgi:DNA-binding beta-propeller fold protein YncE
MTRHRRLAALAAAALVVLALTACSDDDDEGTASTTSSTSTEANPGESELLTVTLDGRPSAVAFVAGDLLVADDGDSAGGGGTVRSLDVETGAVLGSSAVGPQPVALVPVADGAWSIGATGVLTKVRSVADEDGGATTTELGGALVDAVVAGGRLWVADIERSVVHVLDPETGEVVDDPIAVPAGAVRLAVAGERLWVSGLEDQVTPIDTAQLVARQPVQVGSTPIGMAVVQDVLWVANSEDDTVSRISLESGQPVGGPLAVGDAPIALVVDGADVVVLHQDDATLLRLDAETGEPIGAPVDLPMRPRGMTATPSGVWVVGVDPSIAALVAR